MRNVKVIIADDNFLSAKLLSSYCQTSPNLTVDEIVKNGIEVLDKISNNKFDILLLDIFMPIMDGLECLKKINEAHKGIKSIVLSACAEGSIINKAIKLGAKGYITKDSDPKEILQAITSVASGGSYFCKTSMDSLVFNIQKHTVEESQQSSEFSIETLTIREKEVLELACEEFSTKEIADKMCISPRTVETHRKNILKKMNVSSMSKLTVKLKELDYFDPQRA